MINNQLAAARAGRAFLSSFLIYRLRTTNAERSTTTELRNRRRSPIVDRFIVHR